MNINTDLIVDDLTKQIASLAKEKAIFFALATQKEQEIQRLRRELEKLREAKSKEADEK